MIMINGPRRRNFVEDKFSTFFEILKNGSSFFRRFKRLLSNFFYSCIFDVQYTIVSDTGVKFFTLNLIRIEFKFN